MDIFVFLKMLGLKELSEVSTQGHEALIPLATCMALFIALGIAFMEFNVFNRWEKFSTGKFILFKYASIVILITTGCVFIFILFVLLIERQSFTTAIHSIPDFIKTDIFLSILLFQMLFSIVLNMAKTIYDYLGPQAIAWALLGKYNQPEEEDLTFLFIDLKASTSIAERMGHIQYSRFIESSFHLLTESIYQHNATLYQFVGDEVVLLWPTRVAQKTLAPVDLYFNFIAKIEKEHQYFIESFGEIPQFKGAIHAGHVTVTQIRTIKKDIVYHGDVLNTCARILEQCSLKKKDLLVSSTIVEWIQSHARFNASFVMQLALRGKKSETVLHEISTVQ